ncbi:MAG: 50S ribosomal protein L11 methyltransferase [Myxococcales bacterium]|nr:50S ribosomal protein L11 methyltransferase [Myxococcales bacterium]
MPLSPPPRYPHLSLLVPEAQAELASLELFELGALGVEQRDATTLTAPTREASGHVTLLASFADEDGARAALAELGNASGLGDCQAQLDFVVGDDWRDGWRAHFRPSRVGVRLVVQPPWPSQPRPGFEARADDLAITIDPGHAFGTGTHETTRLCLSAIEQRLQARGIGHIARMLDVGCGSGILSIAAARLGVAHVRAIDIDPSAIAATAENAAANGVRAAIEVDGEALESLHARYPLVVANLETRFLLPLATSLRERLEPGGQLLLSGILEGEGERVQQAFAPLKTTWQAQEGTWLALLLSDAEPTDG